MPPRKRTQTAPQTNESDEQTHESADEAGTDSGEEAVAEPVAQAPADAPSDAPAAGPDAEDPPAEPDGSDGEPQRSDVQTDSEPCPECFPGGWKTKPDTVGALGCEHGTWQRDPVN